MFDQNAEQLERLMQEVVEELKAIKQHQENASREFSDFRQEMQTRRHCEWSSRKIQEKLRRLAFAIPSGEESFTYIFETLDSYLSLVFKSIEDLRALRCYLSLTHGILETFEKDDAAIPNYWERLKPVYEILDELQTLDDGDPPILSNAERLIRSLSLNDEVRNTDRQRIRERAEERVREGIRAMFR